MGRWLSWGARRHELPEDAKLELARARAEARIVRAMRPRTDRAHKALSEELQVNHLAERFRVAFGGEENPA